MRRILPLSFVLALLAACATERHAPPPPAGPPPPPPPPPPAGALLPDWRAVVRPPELGRLDGLNEAWTQSLKEVRAGGHAKDLAALGELAEPAAGALGSGPQPGDYRCRTVKLGSKSGRGVAFIVYDWFRCRIEATPRGLKFSKVSGGQRPAGLLYPDTSRRMVLLGSLSVGAEPTTGAYGVRPERDLVGVVEHLPHGGWRIVLPWPYWGSDLDLIELKPAS